MLNAIILLFIIYIPIFGFSLFLLTFVNKKYSISKNSISSLAKLKYPFNIIFNILVSIYGLISFAPLIKFETSFASPLSYLFLIFYIFVSIGTILVGVCPTNSNLKIHKLVSIFLFTSLVILELISSSLFILSESFFVISVFSFILLIFTLILIIKARDMDEESRYSKFEWIVIFGTFIWNVIFSLIILKV